ncbi:hypothetical protein WJX77_012283 [Trebouxia sp. C0004]
MSAHMRDKICAVVQQPDHATPADACGQLAYVYTRNDMPTRASTARPEQRREELNKLQITSRAFKEAKSVIPPGTGRDSCASDSDNNLQAFRHALDNTGYKADPRPMSEQRSDPRVPQKDKDMMW